MIADQWARNINNVLLLSGSALPLFGGIRINYNNQYRAIHLDLERNINNALPLAGSADVLTLAGSGIPLAYIIRISGNTIPCAILINLVLKLHELDGKHNAERIYHKKITPPVRSSMN